MDSRQNHLPVALFRQSTHLRLYIFRPAAANPAPGIGNDTITAELIAAILYFQKRPGMIRNPADL